MRKLLLLILTLTTLTLQGQVKVATHYDAESTASEILDGKIKDYLNPSIDFTIEKRRDKFVTKYDVTADYVESKIKKYFKKGNTEYTSRTNGGYTFTISVINRKDDMEILYYCTFSVDAYTGKIKEVEISKGD